MAIFDYKCQCGIIEEKFVSNRDEVVTCSKCKCEMERIKFYSTTAHHFTNGSGTSNGLLWSIPKRKGK